MILRTLTEQQWMKFFDSSQASVNEARFCRLESFSAIILRLSEQATTEVVFSLMEKSIDRSRVAHLKANVRLTPFHER